MIAIDTSALVAILGDETEAEACSIVIEQADSLVMSASTAAEALIVAIGRDIEDAMAGLIAELPLEIVPVTQATATQVAAAYRRWGKGRHPARLNYGDCFAYVLARERGCPLLYVGNDFAQTDVESAIAR